MTRCDLRARAIEKFLSSIDLDSFVLRTESMVVLFSNRLTLDLLEWTTLQGARVPRLGSSNEADKGYEADKVQSIVIDLLAQSETRRKFYNNPRVVNLLSAASSMCYKPRRICQISETIIQTAETNI